MSKPILKVENLYKSFRVPHEKHSSLKQTVLNFRRQKYEMLDILQGINFEVKEGEFFGIVGRNGSGKSTLLKTIAGIYYPEQGGVQINGRLTPFIELGVGFNNELSGQDNVYLNGAILGLTRKEVEEKYNDIVEFAELEQFMEQKIKNYSSGMQVRLAFSIAIQAHNEILLIDEVLAVGDVNFQQKCFDVFRDLKKQGKTVIFVSHDLDSIEEFCDRVAVIDTGKIKSIGEATKTINDYRTIMAKKEPIQTTTTNKHSGTGEVTIKDAELISEDKKTNTINEDSPFSIKIHFKSKNRIENPVFGLAVVDEKGNSIIGPNTKEAEYKIDFIEDKGSIIAKFDKNILTPGKYSITASCFDGKLVTAFDYVEDICQFRVIGKEKHGSVNIEPEWSISR